MSPARPPRISLLLFVALLVAALAAACGSHGGSAFSPQGDDGGTAGDGTAGGSDGPSLLGEGGSGDAPSGPLAIAPTNSTLSVPFGAQLPTRTFTVTAGGVPVPASFTIDLGQIATIGASSGVLAPSGVIGGVAHVTATFGGQSVSTAITVTVTMQQNGAPAGYDAGDHEDDDGTGTQASGGTPARRRSGGRLHPVHGLPLFEAKRLAARSDLRLV